MNYSTDVTGSTQSRKSFTQEETQTVFDRLRKVSIIFIHFGFTFDDFDSSRENQDAWLEQMDKAAEVICLHSGLGNAKNVRNRVSNWLLERLEREIGFMKSK